MEELNLKQIVEQYPDCLHNSQKLRGLILDLYPECPRGLIRVIVDIAESSFFKEIQLGLEVTDLKKSSWVSHLENEVGCSPKLAISALNIWIKEYIGDYAFKGCVNLAKVKLPKGIKLLHISTFSGCEKISSTLCTDAVSIEDLYLSVRTYNCLRRAGIRTISDIQKLSWDDLLRIRNMNENSAKEIVEKMKIFQK